MASERDEAAFIGWASVSFISPLAPPSFCSDQPNNARFSSQPQFIIHGQGMSHFSFGTPGGSFSNSIFSPPSGFLTSFIPGGNTPSSKLRFWINSA